MRKLIQERQYGFMLLVQGWLLLVAPFTRGRPLLTLLSVGSLLGIFGAVILTIWTARLPRLLAVASGLVAFVTGAMAFPVFRLEAPVAGYLAVCGAAYALFILIAIVSIGVDVLFRERVTVNCILGSICVYIFLGMFFAFLYGVVALLVPGAVEGGKPGPLTPHDLLYFSYMTLTTTGYGDIIPTHPVVRMLATFESITGALYIAIMISRLVGLHVADRGAAKP